MGFTFHPLRACPPAVWLNDVEIVPSKSARSRGLSDGRLVSFPRLRGMTFELLLDQRSDGHMRPVNAAEIEDYPLGILQLQSEAAVALLHRLDPERRAHSRGVRVGLEEGNIVDASARRIGDEVGGDLYDHGSYYGLSRDRCGKHQVRILGRAGRNAVGQHRAP